MSVSFRSLFLGLSIGGLGLSFVACQNSNRDSIMALDASKSQTEAQKKSEVALQNKITCEALKEKKNSQKSLKKNSPGRPQDPAELAEIRELEKQVAEGHRDENLIQLNDRLLEQAHQVFVQVWRTLEPEMQVDPVSVFSDSRKQFGRFYSGDSGLPLAKTSAETTVETTVVKLNLKPVIVRDQDCWPKSLELHVFDQAGKQMGVYSSVSIRTNGIMAWTFNSSFMPQAVGQRQQTLGYQVTCIAGYKSNGQLIQLSCTHLGQEGTETNRPGTKVYVEFDKFTLDIQRKDNIFVGQESRYADLYQVDPIVSVKDIKVPVDVQKISIRYLTTPKEPEKATEKPTEKATEKAGEKTGPESRPAVSAEPQPSPEKGTSATSAPGVERQAESLPESLSATTQGDARDQDLKEKNKAKPGVANEK